ncbi:MAG: hypothetical protein PHF64_00880 [Methanoregula sp.]|nr:hypothetical protein [Methanoregula sp.]
MADYSVGGRAYDHAVLIDSTGAVISSTNPLPITAEAIDPLTNTFTQLTAPGSTTGFATAGRNNHSVFLTVAAIDTTVVVRIEGSADNSAWANLDISGLDTTLTANGTYLFAIPETPMAYIRVTFVSETGGTAATIDAKYVGH